jgi:hypothetical protein
MAAQSPFAKPSVKLSPPVLFGAASWIPIVLAAVLAQQPAVVPSRIVAALWFAGVGLQLFAGYLHFFKKP